jgi:hypothetical protein
MSVESLPGDNTHAVINEVELGRRLDEDLEGRTAWISAHDFLRELWPDDHAPFPVTNEIFSQLESFWDCKQDCFTYIPESYSELHMAMWLNGIGMLLGHIVGRHQPTRKWSCNSWNAVFPGGSAFRKPGLALLSTTRNSPLTGVPWREIHAFAEVTSEPRFPKRMNSMVTSESYFMFIKQHDRRFVPALRFDGSGLFSLIITDREGQIIMSELPLLRGRGNALIFMKILISLMYGGDKDVGLDTTMIRGPDARVCKIYVNNDEYRVVKKIYASQFLIGRGTVVWIVIKNDGPCCILKDSWIQVERVESEIALLKKLNVDPVLGNRVPHLIDGEDVIVNGICDSTGRYRKATGSLAEQRIHRRLVLSPIGISITNFRSIEEFLLAIIDVVEGM